MTKNITALWVPAVLACLLLTDCSSSSAPAAARQEAHPVTQTAELPAMEQAAIAILQRLDEAARKKATFEFTADERKNWHFVPKVRGGLPLREMNAEQKALVMELLRTALSEQGQKKAEGIMQLERVLQVLENRPYENDYRHPELYYLAVFGDPAGSEPWGWRMEGHHLSLNFSSVDRQLAVTPAFFGSNPAIVRDGERAGTQVLKAEQELARELVHMLSEAQRAKAILPGEAPNELLTYVQQKVDLEAYSGLPAVEFTGPQKAKLEALLGAYLNNMNADIAREQWEKLQESGLDKLHFAWMGDTQPGQPHYYRIHGPTLLIEYDNVQNGANHVHSVWRDLTNDFGEDLLREHYAHGHKH